MLFYLGALETPTTLRFVARVALIYIFSNELQYRKEKFRIFDARRIW